MSFQEKQEQGFTSHFPFTTSLFIVQQKVYKVIKRFIELSNKETTVKFLKIGTPDNFAITIKTKVALPTQRSMRQKDANEMANSEDQDQTDSSSFRSRLVWVYTACPDLSVRKLRVITIDHEERFARAI